MDGFNLFKGFTKKRILIAVGASVIAIITLLTIAVIWIVKHVQFI